MTTNENTPNAFYPRGKENSVVAPIVDEAFRRAFPDGVNEKRIGLVDLCKSLASANAPRSSFTEVISIAFPEATEDDIAAALNTAGIDGPPPPGDGPVEIISDALASPTARGVVKMLGTLLKDHPGVSIKDLEDIASTEYEQEEKKRLLAEYATKPVREFVQFDTWVEGPDDDRPNWSYSRTLELMHYPGEVRILIAPDSDPSTVAHLLECATATVKHSPDEVYGKNRVSALDDEISF